MLQDLGSTSSTNNPLHSPRPKESEKKIAKIKLRKSSVHWFQMHLQATRNIIGT